MVALTESVNRRILYIGNVSVHSAPSGPPGRTSHDASSSSRKTRSKFGRRPGQVGEVACFSLVVRQCALFFIAKSQRVFGLEDRGRSLRQELPLSATLCHRRRRGCEGCCRPLRCSRPWLDTPVRNRARLHRRHCRVIHKTCGRFDPHRRLRRRRSGFRAWRLASRGPPSGWKA